MRVNIRFKIRAIRSANFLFVFPRLSRCQKPDCEDSILIIWTGRTFLIFFQSATVCGTSLITLATILPTSTQSHQPPIASLNARSRLPVSFLSMTCSRFSVSWRRVWDYCFLKTLSYQDPSFAESRTVRTFFHLPMFNN